MLKWNNAIQDFFIAIGIITFSSIIGITVGLVFYVITKGV